MGLTLFLVCTGCTLLSGTSATAEMRFRSDTLHASLWKRIYVHIPSAWKAERAVYVREVSDGEMERLVARFEGQNDQNDSVVDGCYQGGIPREGSMAHITLRDTLRGENAGLVFTHEYGHYVWSEILTAPERARYRRIWREQLREGSLITSYAAESEEEGFAESFSYYIRKSATLRHTDYRSWQFLDNVQADREAAPIE